MRKAQTPSCKRCGVEKETSVHILCEYTALEKIRMQTLGFARMDPEHIKKARLSGITALGKGLDSWIAPINLNERDRAMRLWAWLLGQFPRVNVNFKQQLTTLHSGHPPKGLHSCAFPEWMPWILAITAEVQTLNVKHLQRSYSFSEISSVCGSFLHDSFQGWMLTSSNIWPPWTMENQPQSHALPNQKQCHAFLQIQAIF